jgi:hypothetical protein
MSWSEFGRVLAEFLPGRRMKSFEGGVRKLLDAITTTKATYPHLRLYSASVLVLYDGDQPDGAVHVFLIDFAHAYADVVAAGGLEDDESFDDSSITGLKSLLSLTHSSALVRVASCPLRRIDACGRESQL